MADNTQQNLEDAEERITKLQQQRAEFAKEELDNKREFLNIFKSIETSMYRQLGIQDNMNTDLKSTNSLEKELQKNRNKLTELKQREAALSKGINTTLLDQIKNEKQNFDNIRDKTKALDSQLDNLKSQEKYLIDAERISSDDGKEVRKQIRDTARELAKANNIEEVSYQNLLSYKKQMGADDVLRILSVENLIKAISESNVELNQSVDISRRLDRNIFSILNNITSAIPQLGRFSQDFREAAEASREAGGGGAGSVAGFKSLLESATSTNAILLAIVASGFKADQQVTNIARSLSISKGYADGIRQDFVEYSRLTSDIYITTDRLVEGQLDLTKQLGIAGEYTGKQVEDYVRLTKLMGLTNDEAGSLVRLGLIINKSTEDTVKSILKGSFAAQLQNKVSFDNKQILEDVSRLSAGILTKFQENPEALGEAVVQAKALGLSLNKIDSIGDSLLDFEGSLERTLKAELLTGRQINVERAREAALLGDQQSLMTEIASQVGDLNSFQNLNVLAQKSLAEAFGMSRDELASMLLDQAKFQALGDVSNKTATQQLSLATANGVAIDSILYKTLQTQSAQETYNMAVSKLQDILGNIVAGPVGEILEAFSQLSKHTTALRVIFAGIASIITGKIVYGIGQSITKMIEFLALSSATAASEIAGAEALTLGAATPLILGGTATVIAGLGAYGVMKDNEQHVQDAIISPDDRVLYSGKKGSIKFDKDDTIVAGTNLNTSNNYNSNIQQTTVDNSVLENKLDAVIAGLEKIFRKDSNVYISESKLAAATATPIGTNIHMNISSLA